MLIDQIQADLKQAMLAKNELKVSTLRMLLSELKNAQIATGRDLEDGRSLLSDKDAITVVQKEIKRRREGADGFRSGGREELAVREESEADILKAYLPEQLSDDQLTKIVQEAITELGAASVTQMGQVMGKVMAQVGQSAQPSQVSSIVKAELS